MNATLEAAIAAGLASIERVRDAPTGALGYGTDLSCTTDLDPDLAETDPMSPLGIGEGVVRCWDTPRGSLPNDGKDAASRGLSLREELHRGTTDRDLRALERRLATEALKDDRIDRIVVEVRVTSTGTATVELEVIATVTPAGVGGPFQLVLAATSAEIIVKAIAGVTS